MKLFNELVLLESEKSSQKEIKHVISIVNSLYNEWRKIGRRKNAVDLVTTTANKLSNIDPSTVDKIHEATKLKISSLIIKCFDIPYWKPISEKQKIYKKLINLIKKVENSDVRSDSTGNVRDIIMTRLSASLCYNSNNKNIFVAYEPKIPESYLRYLFGKELPEKTFKMQSMPLPEDFDSLVKQLSINHEKAVAKFNLSGQQKAQD